MCTRMLRARHRIVMHKVELLHVSPYNAMHCRSRLARYVLHVDRGCPDRWNALSLGVVGRFDDINDNSGTRWPVGVADGEVVAIRSAPLLFCSIDLVVRGVVEVVRDEDIVINVHGNLAVAR